MSGRILRSVRFRFGAWLARRNEARERRDIIERASFVLEGDDDIRFMVYPWDRPRMLQLLHGTFDAAEFAAIARLVHEGDLAFDVGANIGKYSVLLSRICGQSGRVWAFEPVPDTYWRLRETLALNRCDNVTTVQAAMCHKSGKIDINLFAPEYCGWNSIGLPEMITPTGKRVSPDKSVEVPSLTIDEFCDSNGIDKIDFLKVDVEGFEAHVFQGAARMLREHRVGCVCFEVSKAPLKASATSSRAIFEILESFGYRAYGFDESHSKFYGPVQDTDEYYANFYASTLDLPQTGLDRLSISAAGDVGAGK